MEERLPNLLSISISLNVIVDTMTYVHNEYKIGLPATELQLPAWSEKTFSHIYLSAASQVSIKCSLFVEFTRTCGSCMHACIYILTNVPILNSRHVRFRIVISLSNVVNGGHFPSHNSFCFSSLTARVTPHCPSCLSSKRRLILKIGQITRTMFPIECYFDLKMPGYISCMPFTSM